MLQTLPYGGSSSLFTKTDSSVCYRSVHGAVVIPSCSALVLQFGGSSDTGCQNVGAQPCDRADHKSDSLGFTTALCCCVTWLIALYPWVKSWPKLRQWKTGMTLTPDILFFLNKVSQNRFLINQVWEKESSYESLEVVIMFWGKERAVTEGWEVALSSVVIQGLEYINYWSQLHRGWSG